jgi:hypothetical protein
VYVSGTLQLDYTNANIVVDVNGVPTQAVAVDASGAALKTVSLDVQLDKNKPLTITAGRPSLLELDFDLLASNSIDTTKSPVQVTVQPVIVASIDVVASREARVRGPLTSVDTASGTYHVNLRPFNLASGALGDVTVRTDANTQFEINGTQYVGSAGIAQLATPRPARRPRRTAPWMLRTARSTRRACMRVRASPARSSTRLKARSPRAAAAISRCAA